MQAQKAGASENTKKMGGISKRHFSKCLLFLRCTREEEHAARRNMCYGKSKNHIRKNMINGKF